MHVGKYGHKQRSVQENELARTKWGEFSGLFMIFPTMHFPSEAGDMLVVTKRCELGLGEKKCSLCQLVFCGKIT